MKRDIRHELSTQGFFSIILPCKHKEKKKKGHLVHSSSQQMIRYLECLIIIASGKVQSLGGLFVIELKKKKKKKEKEEELGFRNSSRCLVVIRK